MPRFGTAAFGDTSVADLHQGGGLGTSAFSPVELTMVNTAKIALAKVTTPINKDLFNVTWEASG